MSNVPSAISAVEISRPGGPDVLTMTSRPMPAPGLGEVLIKVAAAGVNRPDVLQRMGHYPPPPGASDIPGLEVSGTIVALGQGVTRWALGDAVCALLTGGGYANYAVAPAGQCLPVPKGVCLVDAASLPETYFTVWSNLFERAYVDNGDTVLAHGGTSGIGVATILLCKAFDIRIFVTCGSDEKCAAARALGADAAINYKTHDFVEEVKSLTSSGGVDVVLDMVGGSYVPRNLACLVEGGRHVSIAVQGGATAEINLLDIMRRRLTLTGSTLRARSTAFKAALAASLEREVWPLFVESALSPVIDSRYPLAQAALAHERMQAGSHIGKIILEI